MAWPGQRAIRGGHGGDYEIACRQWIVDACHVDGEVLGETRVEEDALADGVSRWGDVGVGRRIRGVAC
jgi:hypothetical protein